MSHWSQASPDLMLRDLHELFRPLAGRSGVREPVLLRRTRDGYALVITRNRWSDGDAYVAETAAAAVELAWRDSRGYAKAAA